MFHQLVNKPLTGVFDRIKDIAQGEGNLTRRIDGVNQKVADSSDVTETIARIIAGVNQAAGEMKNNRTRV